MKLVTRTRRFLTAVAVTAAALFAAPAAAPAADPPAGTTPAKADDAKVIPWGRKVTKNLPENRQNGSIPTKGFPTAEAALFFIAPKTTGLTTRELPDVYWYVTQPSREIVFTLTSVKTKKTLLRLALKDVQPGFHKIDLSREAKAAKFAGLEANEGGDAAALTQVYRMALSNATKAAEEAKEQKMFAAAYVARVKGDAARDPKDYGYQIQNELWFDAVDSLASALSTDQAKAPAPRKQFTQLLEAEEVLRSTVNPSAPEEERRKAVAVEDAVLKKLSVPDPIDLQSDKWEPKSVPDPIDLNSVPDPIDLNSVPDPIDLNSQKK